MTNLEEILDSEVLRYFWTFQLSASALWGLLCFLIGLILGLMMWSHLKRRVNAVMADTRLTLAECEKLETELEPAD